MRIKFIALRGIIFGGIVLAASRLPAAWTIIEDFDALPVGVLTDGAGGWSFLGSGGADTSDFRVILDPAGGTNRVVQMAGEFDRTLAKNFPGGVGIAEGTVGTLYFRFRMGDFTVNDDGAAGPDAGPSVGVGIADAASSGAPGMSASWVNVNGRLDGGSTMAAPGTNGINGVSTTGGAAGGGTQISITDQLSTDTWYSLWLVSNHVAGEDVGLYDVFIQGGSAFATQTQIGDALQFRQNPIGTLTRVFLRPNNNNSDAGNVIYFDDYFVDATGSNLSVPSPITLRGDFDGIGGITTTDFAILAQNFNATNATYAQGDFDLSQTIDLDDFVLFRDAYHAANPSLNPLTVADLMALVNGVPEPSGVALIALGGISLAATNGRRRRRTARTVASGPEGCNAVEVYRQKPSFDACLL